MVALCPVHRDLFLCHTHNTYLICVQDITDYQIKPRISRSTVGSAAFLVLWEDFFVSLCNKTIVINEYLLDAFLAEKCLDSERLKMTQPHELSSKSDIFSL